MAGRDEVHLTFFKLKLLILLGRRSILPHAEAKFLERAQFVTVKNDGRKKEKNVNLKYAQNTVYD